MTRHNDFACQVRDPWRDLSFVRGRITPAILQNWTTSHRMHLRRSPGRCVRKNVRGKVRVTATRGQCKRPMDAASSASRAALGHNAFDGDRLGLGTTIDRLSAGAAHRAFKGQLDASGKNGCARIGALYFFSFCFRDQFAYFFLQHVPVLGTQYNYQVTIQESRGGSKRRGQRNTAGKTPPIHPCTTHAHASLAFPGNGFCGPFHQTIGWDGPV